MVWTPLAAALAEAVEGPPDDDDYPEKRWFLTRARADLQVSDTPDPLVTGPSIRRDLRPPSRAERALGWVVGTMVREPMALACYLVSLLAVGYVLWHLGAAIVEGRLRLGW